MPPVELQVKNRFWLDDSSQILFEARQFQFQKLEIRKLLTLLTFCLLVLKIIINHTRNDSLQTPDGLPVLVFGGEVCLIT